MARQVMLCQPVCCTRVRQLSLAGLMDLDAGHELTLEEVERRLGLA